MQQNRLITLLNALSKKEIREAGKFVRSPFHNSREDVIRLFDYLSECLFVLKLVPDKKQIFKRVYPGESYNDHRVRVIMSFLFQCLERFILLQTFLADEVKVKLQLAEEYRTRQLPNHFQRTIKSLKKRQTESPIRNADYYHDHVQVQLETYYFSSNNQRTGEYHLQEISDNIDLAFLTLKLKQTCFSIAHQNMFNKEYHFGLLSEMLQYIQQKQFLQIPAISVYYHCYHALTHPEEDQHYFQLKEALLKYAHHFPSTEIRDLFLLTINYCIRRMNAGIQRFEQEVLDWYQIGLQEEHLMNNGHLSRFTYRNITTMGLIIQDYQWVENFIHEYKDRLEKQYRESAYGFNLARLAYAKKDYSTALQLLQQSAHKDLLLNLGAKTLALKIYYELEEYNLLDSHLDAMTNFIRRKKIIGYHR
ncbi:MAG: hypothetical protein AAF985_12775, partial [Bacteroidota bacterium]